MNSTAFLVSVGSTSTASKLAAAGLDALECMDSRHSTGVVDHYSGMAKDLGMAITGGSDCHGRNKSHPLIGRQSHNLLSNTFDIVESQ